MAENGKASNLEKKLNTALGEILKSSGYIFEILYNKKQMSNVIVGNTNQLITPNITAQLSSSIAKFEDILDDTVCKFNDAKWCVDQIIVKQMEEMKLKEEEEKKKIAQEEEEKKRKVEEAELETMKKLKDEKDGKEEIMMKEEKQNSESIDFDTYINSNVDFDLNELPLDTEKALDIPNPSDILSSLNYQDVDKNPEAVNATNQNNDFKSTEGIKQNVNKEPDFDMNNILNNDESILNSLDMPFMEEGLDGQVNGQGLLQDDAFDVDTFLNQQWD